jgi:hypothetical protein
MKIGAQFGRVLAVFSLMLILATVPCLAQNHRNDRSAPRPSQQPSHSQPSRREQGPSRPDARPRYQSAPQRNYPSRPERNYPAPSQRGYEGPRPYQPPAQGHHSGQWLDRYRQQPLDQQRRALQNDPTFRRLPPQRQQQLEQRLQRFDSMPADRQQQVLQRMETWEHLTPQQKQQFRSVDSQFRSLPPDRQSAVRNAIQSLRAMPPDARQRAIQSGRFSQFSPQEQQILNNTTHLPLAPAPDGRSEQPNSGPQRYIPRPPR